MTVQTIVYIVLSALSLIAVYAVGTPVAKPEEGQNERTDEQEGHGHHSL